MDAAIPYEPVAQPKHVYTIEFHRALYTDELFEVYQAYEKAVHKKDAEKAGMKRHICSSPVYDPENPADEFIAKRPAPYGHETVDEGREFKDEGQFPGRGSFHFYHRIDGRLAAVGVVDITKHVLVSKYFIYHPDFSELCLGVVGAIHEIEYMRMVQKKFNSDFKYYSLGALVLDCPKVNYKMNYKPGVVLCPRTKQLLDFDTVHDKIKHYARLPLKQKRESLTSTPLVELPFGAKTQNESIAEFLKNNE